VARFVPFVIVERRCFGNVGGFAPAVPRFRRHDVARSRSAVERSAERETYVVGAAIVRTDGKRRRATSGSQPSATDFSGNAYFCPASLSTLELTSAVDGAGTIRFGPRTAVTAFVR